MSASVTLLTGGARCGKSRRALELAAPYARKVMIAAAVAFDDEMAERIRAHRAERGDDWETLERPVDIAGALSSLSGPGTVAVVDCLTIWLANLFHGKIDERAVDARIDEWIETLKHAPVDTIVVTNEVGWGIVPADPGTRRYRDAAGRLNRRVAEVADVVELLVAGIPMPVKGRPR